MSACCDPREYDTIFTSRYARRTAGSYRRSGLDDTAERMVGFLASQGLDGATVLEIGGGVGGLHVELLRRGAGSAVNVELSTAYESEAELLLREWGLADRVDRRILDIAVDPQEVPVADVVVLHRVVCCYPDFAALLAAAANRTGRLMAFSYPRPRLLTRAETRFENFGYALRRRAFRTYVHSPQAMIDVVTGHGLTPLEFGENARWQFTGAVRGPDL